MMTLLHAIAATSLLVAAPLQDLSLQERESLYESYMRAPRRVQGGRVRARWLDDGSSFIYRARRETLFVDPAEGLPRSATGEDRERESTVEGVSRQGRADSPASDCHVRLESGNLTLVAAGARPDRRLTEDAGDYVFYQLESEAWSPDGSAFYALRLDATDVHHLPVVDYLKAVETVEWPPYTKTGTPLAALELAVFHYPSLERVAVGSSSPGGGYLFPIGWQEGGRALLYLRLNREATQLDLVAADPRTGKSRTILTDTSETFVGGLDFITGGWREYFTPIDGGERFLWLSERDGWRQLYMYDYDGALIARVTRGTYPVQRVVDVDTARKRVYLIASAEERPYDTHLYRTDLGEGELVRLTEATGVHEVQLSPSRRYFVDVHSSLDRPSRSELRDVEGELICVLDEADTSALEELGYEPPEAFVVKAADEETDLHGVIYKPAWFDPAQRYPVIDFIYTGPFITVVPREYMRGSFMIPRAQAMAQMGFIVLVVDPRGTTGRGKAFQDASYGRIGEIEIPDHVATLHQVAEDRPYMDLGRVGVYGHSWGGYFALRAMLTAPGVFHVGVSSAPGDLTENAPINEPYMRLPVNNPKGYAAGSNPPLAANLEGKLMLVHGTADVNAPFSTSMRMVDALIGADKEFDLLVVPGATHSIRGKQGAYVARRIRSYFLEHLVQ